MSRRLPTAILSACLSLQLAACSAQNGGGDQPRSQASPPAGAGSSASNAAGANAAPAPAPNEKVYRGSLGERGLEARLAREGDSVKGSYAYDGIGESLRLEGRAGAGGKLELAEYDAGGQQTGKWSCEAAKQGEWDQDLSCKWTKPDGGGELFVALFEQPAAQASAPRVVPKVIEDRKFGVRASYPQLASPSAPAAEHFNRLLEKKVGDAVRDFTEALGEEKNLYFNANYNVLLATNDLVSVELSYDSYSGGAHPSFSMDAVTYDLRADRERKLEDIFKPGSAYRKAISEHAHKDIRRRAGEIEAEDAKQSGAKPERQAESPVSIEQLEEISAFGLTPRGLMVYYELPHVIAVFTRNFVPYAVIREHLKPEGPASRFAR